MCILKYKIFKLNIYDTLKFIFKQKNYWQDDGYTIENWTGKLNPFPHSHL